eukprot:TRINITY_DN22498_c0_g1_i1.p1 TRINITY_DN22498_c0_g1~~TRINITY_DN22498_c0_g1_i1.p1  ORF type:complete len:493 (+),score=67.33 TRINITY_DN22498_c0_g1_i1:78-1556(+)
MDYFGQLDEIVLSRLFACLLQREALGFAALGLVWPKLVAAHLRRLVISPTMPLAVVSFAAESFHRLREIVVDAKDAPIGEEFYNATAALVERLQTLPLDRVVLRAMDLHGASLAQSTAQLQLLVNAVQAMPRGPSLQQLVLEHVNLGHSSPPRALQCLVGSLQASGPALATLILNDCDLHSRGANAVCTAISTGCLSAQLQRLDLSLNGLGQPGATRVAQLLPQLRQLRALLLKSNSLGPAGALALAGGLAAVASTLVELDLSENGLGRAGVEALRTADLQLQVLSLQRSWLGPDDTTAVTSLLRSMADTIVKLDIAENKMEAAGVRQMLGDLPPLPELRCLNLAQSLFATEGFGQAPFARLAEVAPRLEELNLTSCRLGSDETALQTVMSALPQTVKVLHLGASDLRRPKLELVLVAIRRLQSLETLSLIQANLDDAAANFITADVPHWTTPQLRLVDISGNPIRRDTALRLLEALRRESAFRQLKGMRLR